MPEDQGVKGDKWTLEACRLLEALGWVKIADCNIDIPGPDGHMHGIDALFRYKDGFDPTRLQGVFLEAKCYRTTSFNPSKLKDWVKRFDNKLRELRMSSEFHEEYPAMAETYPGSGVLAIWFSDFMNYHSFADTFKEALSSARPTGKRPGDKFVNRLFIMDNEPILRLCSLIQSKMDWDSSHPSELSGSHMTFYYPSSVGSGFPIQEIPILNLEYIFSKFVLARATESVSNFMRQVDIVFYFGSLNMASFRSLKSALLSMNMLSSANKLYIYTYERDDNFRKIKPDVISDFNSNGSIDLEFKEMHFFADLPPWIRTDRS